MFLVVLSILAISEATDNKTPHRTVIGIDLGTSYSCVAVFQNGKVNIIANEAGSGITPSVVSFTDTERLIGDAAKRQMITNPTNTIFAVKRLIGLQSSDKAFRTERRRLPYTVVSTWNHPYVQVQFKGETRLFSPEEISAMILTKMKTMAEAFLGHEVKDAVVTVPSYFTDTQRKATIDAGKIAGLNVLRILNEPVAASLAYGFHQKGNKTILVFDLGGGSCDVAVVAVEDGIFEVLATNGNTHLGGEDFDQRLIGHLRGAYKKKTGKDCSKNPKAVAQLKRESEKAKHALSSLREVTIEIDNFNDGDDFVETLTRRQFEELNEDLFGKTIEPIKNVLKDSGLEKGDIDDIVLIGGSTKIPKIQQLIRDFFDGKEPSKSINPGEAVAYGAAIQAGIFSEEEGANPVIVVNVNSFTLGIEAENGTMEPLIPRNSRVPISQSRMFTTIKNNQGEVNISVFEGERPIAKDNHFLGSFDLSGIRPAQPGIPTINVTFEIDSNGKVYVSAEDKATKVREQIIIDSHEARLSEPQRKDAMKREEAMRKEDKRIEQGRAAKNRVEGYLFRVRSQINDEKTGARVAAKDKDKVAGIIEEGFEWLEKHPSDGEDVYDRKVRQLQDALAPLLGDIGAAGRGGQAGGAKVNSRARSDAEANNL